MRASLLIVLALALFGPLSNAASAESDKTIEFGQLLYDNNGDPDLNASSEGRPVTWERCLPGVGCEVLAGTSASLEPGPTPPGTTFRARLAFVTNAEVTTSPAWGGRLTNTAPPVVTGLPRVMTRLSATRATWVGGWGGDTDATTFFACKQLSSSSCEVVTGDWYESGEERVDLPVGPRFAGWHLLLASYRNPRDAAWPAMAEGSQRDNPLTEVDASTRVDQLGKIQADPRYSVDIVERPKLSRSKRFTLARVKCPGVCRIDVHFNSTTWHFLTGATKTRINKSGVVRIHSTQFKPGIRVNYVMEIRGAQLASGGVRIAR